MRFLIAFVVATFLVAAPAHALYDPSPLTELRNMPGAWKGTLTYNDYIEPGKMVTLETKAVISMTRPDELSLFFVFDDGPRKTVYSYEQIRFDFAKAEVRWTSGVEKKEVSVSHIVSKTVTDDRTQIVFEGESGDHRDRHTVTTSVNELVIRKEEIDKTGHSALRDEYRFARSAP